MNHFISEKPLVIKRFPPKAILVEEGKVSDQIFFINKGLIRAFYNAEGKEITLQFFFEGESVASLESFLYDVPSAINIETIENCEVSILEKAVFLQQTDADQAFKDWFYQTAIEKLIVHTGRLLSLLKNKPFDRYQQLLTEKPEILQRVPQHYIASYLGITPVSLSRIRNRKI